MTAKKINPTNPTSQAATDAEAKATDDAKTTERKTANGSIRFRKTGRKTNSAGCRV
jgi:anti-sigma28 factor (negative regulator of flagellin synthesis)